MYSAKLEVLMLREVLALGKENINIVKYSTYYLGCRLNQAEIEFFEDYLSKIGLERSKDGEADIIIFNTCSVTHKAEKDSYKNIRRVFQTNPNSKIFITGCIVPLNKVQINQVKEKIIDNNNILKDKANNLYIIPSTEKEKIIKIIEEELINKNFINGDFCTEKPNNGTSNGSIHQKVSKRFKYYVKVQDGCNHFCTFCIIPYTRGRSKSKKIEEVIEQIKAISNTLREDPEFFAEITLTGVCLGEYGLDINTSLATLLERIVEITPSNTRIRLSSMDLITLDEKLINVIASSDKICKHLHLSMQSGSNRILQMMKRNYTIEYYLEVVQKLNESIPDLGLTTDIIVGFPSETEKDFEETLDAVKKANFHRIHIFPFSFRPYTYAYKYYRNIPINHKQIKEFEKILLSLSLEQSKKFINQRINKTYDILIEENGYGYTHNFIRVKTNYQGNMTIKKGIIEGIEEEKSNFAVAKVKIKE